MSAVESLQSLIDSVNSSQHFTRSPGDPPGMYQMHVLEYVTLYYKTKVQLVVSRAQQGVSTSAFPLGMCVRHDMCRPLKEYSE